MTGGELNTGGLLGAGAGCGAFIGGADLMTGGGAGFGSTRGGSACGAGRGASIRGAGFDIEGAGAGAGRGAILGAPPLLSSFFDCPWALDTRNTVPAIATSHAVRERTLTPDIFHLPFLFARSDDLSRVTCVTTF